MLTTCAGCGRPKLLDLFCGQGGATRGYQLAGFCVTGVDLSPQPRYIGERFIRADALDYLRVHGSDYAAIHASPPCQAYTELTSMNGRAHLHPRLIAPTRALLRAAGRPYVIENVTGARRDLIGPVMLCAAGFGLASIRHRWFETSWPMQVPPHRKHAGRVRGWRHGEYHDGPYLAFYGKGGGKATVNDGPLGLGIDWMDWDGLRESIPPAMTELIGGQLIAAAREQVAA